MKEKIFSIYLEQELYQVAIQRMLEILLPGYSFRFVSDRFVSEQTHTGEPVIELRLLQGEFEIKEPLITEIVLIDGNTRYLEQHYHYEILDKRYGIFDYQRRGKDLLKRHIYLFFASYLSEKLSPWGILTGIRPTKLVHYLRDKEFSFSEIGDIFRNVYAVSEEKVRLLQQIGQVEENNLPSKKEAGKRVSLYLGIPFCPSRCRYCSFPSFSLEKHGSFVRPFLKAIFFEIESVGRFIQRNRYQVDSIYIGGGTPTSLSTEEMDSLLSKITQFIPTEGLIEFSVEAGRPDTITFEKLKIMYDYGVNRISINPQTMQQRTLDAIGRCHSVEEINQTFMWAKKIGFQNINADVIIGLPGETFSDIQSTMKRILFLKPDSLTVHTLALKKASSWWETARNLPFPKDQEVTGMVEYVSKLLTDNCLLPYYMYRQKYILGNQENVGYSLSGKESLYNMIMIEERETVIGLGGGAVTKVVNPEDWSLVRHSNPKYPGDYIDSIERIVTDKLSLLTSFQV